MTYLIIWAGQFSLFVIAATIAIATVIVCVYFIRGFLYRVVSEWESHTIAIRVSMKESDDFVRWRHGRVASGIPAGDDSLAKEDETFEGKAQ